MILVDQRSGSKELLRPLQRLGLPAVDSTFDGDVAFEGRGEGGKPVLIGIEYKKLPDLVQSLRTGRLQGHQLLKMQQAYDFSWLLIEGELLFDEQGKLLRRAGRRLKKPMPGGMTMSELYKRLLVLQLLGGMQPWWTQSQAQTLQFISSLYRTWTDVALDQHKSHIAIYRPPTLVPMSTFRTVVSGLPDVHVKISKRAEEHFGTLRSCFCGDVQDWMQIEGVGKQKAQQLVKLIREGE